MLCLLTLQVGLVYIIVLQGYLLIAKPNQVRLFFSSKWSILVADFGILELIFVQPYGTEDYFVPKWFFKLIGWDYVTHFYSSRPAKSVETVKQT